MKKYLLALSVLIIPHLVRAQGMTYVQEVATSSGTVFTISVASQPAVDVASITANGRLLGSYAMEIYNPSSSTNTVNCGYDSQVSTSISSNYYGREVAPGTGVVFHILNPILKLFCMSQSVTGATRCTITQLR